MRVLAMGDTHCGHIVGLTPPEWQVSGKRGNLQKECWRWFSKELASIKPVDVLFLMGDMIEGSNCKNGGAELLTVDRLEQCAMAESIINKVGAKVIVMIYGTDYHTGSVERYEKKIAEGVGATIGIHEWVTINGITFDLKHFCSSSSIPHGRHTALSRERLWNTLWAEHDLQPKSHVIIRAHVHYYAKSGGSDWEAMTCPALQAAGTRYGASRCSGLVDYGFIHFDVEKDGSYICQPHFAKLQYQKVSRMILQSE